MKFQSKRSGYYAGPFTLGNLPSKYYQKLVPYSSEFLFIKTTKEI